VEAAGGMTGPAEVRSVTPDRSRIEAKPASGRPQPEKPAAAAKPKPDRVQTAIPLEAPMPGMIVSFEKQAGDSVKAGETLVVLEAMKMENALAAPAAGTIKKIFFKPGDSVAKGDVLCIIA